MPYLELAPPERLRRAVVSFWSVRATAAQAPRRIYPDGCFDLVFALDPAHPSASVVGPMTRAIVVPAPTPGGVFGIRFRPGPASRLFGPPLADLRDAAVDADRLLGSGVSGLVARLGSTPAPAARVRLAADFLERRLASVPADPALGRRISAAVDAARRGFRVADLAGRLGLTTRQLERSLLRDVGLRPKELIRLARFRAALERIRTGRIATFGRLAYELGYADQAHFTREFRRFAGHTPSAPRARPATSGAESDLFKTTARPAAILTP